LVNGNSGSGLGDVLGEEASAVIHGACARASRGAAAAGVAALEGSGCSCAELGEHLEVLSIVGRGVLVSGVGGTAGHVVGDSLSDAGEVASGAASRSAIGGGQVSILAVDGSASDASSARKTGGVGDACRGDVEGVEALNSVLEEAGGRSGGSDGSEDTCEAHYLLFNN